MSEFKISCPNCRQHLLCNDSYRGVQFPCPNCGTTIAVPPVAGSALASGPEVDSTGSGPSAPREFHPHIPGRPHIPIRPAGKSWLTTFLLAWFLGGFGVDRIYNGRIGLGIGKFVTGGALGLWSLIDVLLLLAKKYQDGKGNYLQPSKRGHMLTALAVMAASLLLAVVVIGAAVRGITSEFDRMAKSGFAKIESHAGHSGQGFASPKAVFEAMKTNPPHTPLDLILVLPPEEQYGMAYFSFLTARMAVNFQTDVHKKQEAEKDFTALIEKYRLADKVEIGAMNSWEQNKAMATKAFADLDLTAFVEDSEAFCKKYETETFKTDDASNDPKPVSLKDLKVEGDEASGTALYSDDTEKPIVFLKSGGGWFYSQEKTDMKSSGGVNGQSGGNEAMVLIVTFDSEASMSRATKERLLQGVAYDRSQPATLEAVTNSHHEATLGFRLPASADKEAIIQKIRASPGVTKVDNFLNDKMKAVFAGLLEEAFRKELGADTNYESPALSEARAFARRTSCANNLKQVGLGFRIWAGDHSHQFPFNVPAAKGGTLEHCERTAGGFDANAFRHFQVLSNEFNIPRLLICPGDKSTKPATDWESLNSSNVSYQLRTGPQVNKKNLREVLVRCPIDGNTLYCDGQVKHGGDGSSNSVPNLDSPGGRQGRLIGGAPLTRLEEPASTISSVKSSPAALRFDGKNDWLELPPIDWQALPAFTFEVWVRDWNGTIGGQGAAGDPENSIWLALGETDNKNLYPTSGWESKARNKATRIGPAPTNRWVHFAMVFDGKNQSFYLDGQLKHRVAAPRPGPFDMRRSLGFGRGGKGLLRSTRISSTARYQNSFRPTERWKTDGQTLLLLEASNRSGNTLMDSSSHGNNARIHGATVYEPASN